MTPSAHTLTWDLTLPTRAQAPLWAAPPTDPTAQGARVLALCAGADLRAAPGESLFGFVGQGAASVEGPWGTLRVGAGMYFALPPGGRALGVEGWGVAVAQPDHAALFMVGGPVEAHGRLRYIDGCTDTLLISPPRLGDPCLNLLCLPPRTRQRAHTHPSARAGVIVSGTGRCVLPDGELPLKPGLAFVIPTGAVHCFHTDDAPLRVIAYHPDSDFGPTDADHPMINRTLPTRPC